MKHIVFDLGNVLIQWDAPRAFAGHFDDPDAARRWMAQIGFDDWNRRQDGGRSMAEGIEAARAGHGDLAAPLDGYLAGFPASIAEPVPGSWQIAEALSTKGHALYAITNWGRETWPAAPVRYPRLGTLFRDIVVSGIEGMLKPDPAIYRLLLDRNGLVAADCIFIDDSAANVAGALAVGMDAIRFTDADALRAELAQRGLA